MATAAKEARGAFKKLEISTSGSLPLSAGVVVPDALLSKGRMTWAKRSPGQMKQIEQSHPMATSLLLCSAHLAGPGGFHFCYYYHTEMKHRKFHVNNNNNNKKDCCFCCCSFLIFRKRFYIFSDKILKLHSGFFFSFHFMLGFSFQTDNTASFACATTFAFQNNVSSCL